MSMDKVERLSKFIALLQKFLDGNEFIEIKLGLKEIRGANLRIQGATLYCNIEGLPTKSVRLPNEWITKAQALLLNLKQTLKDQLESI